MKLKQKLAIGLCTFYLLSVIGVALSMHFCGGKLASIAVFDNKTACKYCKTDLASQKDDSCCKNTKVDVKVKDSHQTESSFKLAKIFGMDAYFHAKIGSFVKWVWPSFFSKVENKVPPKLNGVALHVFNCVFRN